MYYPVPSDRRFSPFVNGPKSHSPQSLASMSSQHLPPACGARQLGKLKRFLTTLIAFGSDMSVETGDRVKAVILALVNSNITVEEFHNKLQEITNFPLRPFVIPFLKANLPLLQRELLHCARLNRQSPAQYLSSNEQFLFDHAGISSASSERGNGSGSSAPAAADRGSRDTGAVSPPESRPPVGQSTPSSGASEGGGGQNGTKRKLTRSDSHDSSGDEAPPLTKRPAQNRSASASASASTAPNLSPAAAAGLVPPTCAVPLNLSASANSAVHHAFSEQFDRDRERIFRSLTHSNLDFGPFRSSSHHVTPDQPDRVQAPEEWKSIEELLNKIMDNTSRVRSLMSAVRERSRRDQEQLSSLLKERKIMCKASPTEEQINEVKRRASYYYEEAVSEVKRQALSELQKAIATAEQRAGELLAQERSKMARELDEARRKAREEVLREWNRQEEGQESCRNCGRKASETCSGCNIARYCGSFCQHKDWSRHQSVCGNRKEDAEDARLRTSDDSQNVDVKEEVEVSAEHASDQ